MNSGDLTALGTILLAVVTLAAVLTTIVITGQDRRGAAQRLRDERAHSDKQLADQQAFSDAQITQERQIARDREQLSEAYAVQVTMGEKPAGAVTGNVQRPVDNSVRILAVMIVNRGRYTITDIEARFCADGSSSPMEPHELARLGGFDGLPQRLGEGFSRLEDDSGCGDVLAPGDVGMRMESDPVNAASLAGPYPVVRWADRWGTRWEHNRGQVRKIGEGEQWVP